MVFWNKSENEPGHFNIHFREKTGLLEINLGINRVFATIFVSKKKKTEIPINNLNL